jgi:hypothetical protein
VIRFIDRKLHVSKHASHMSSFSTGSSSRVSPLSWGIVYDVAISTCAPPEGPNISSTCVGSLEAWGGVDTLEAIVDNLGRFDSFCTAGGLLTWQCTEAS